jgi:hypothetical protein
MSEESKQLKVSVRDQSLNPYQFYVGPIRNKWEVINGKMGRPLCEFDDEYTAVGVALTLNSLIGGAYDQGVDDGFEVGVIATIY